MNPLQPRVLTKSERLLMIVDELLSQCQLRSVLGSSDDIGGRIQVAGAEPTLDRGPFQIL
jgi:hypothetical protein